MRVSMRGLRRLNQRHREITRKNVSGLSYVSRYPILVSSRERIRSGSECLGRLGNIGERGRGERGLSWKRTRSNIPSMCFVYLYKAHGSMARGYAVCRKRAVTLSNFSSWFFYSIRAGMLRESFTDSRLYSPGQCVDARKIDGVKKGRGGGGVGWIREET